MSTLCWLVLAVGCRFGAPDRADTGPFGVGGAGLFRLGPPAPTGGVYDLAIHPESGRIFVSNQRVPFITVADAATGEWLDAIDLQETGEQRFPSQRLYVIGDVLHATNESGDAMLRYDVFDLEPLESIIPQAPMTAHDATNDALWIIVPERVKCYHDGLLVQDFAVDFHANEMSVDGETIAFLNKEEGEVRLLTTAGRQLWEADLDGDSYGGVLAVDGRIFVTDRENGRVVSVEKGKRLAWADVGADPFSVFEYGDEIIVQARLGASLPMSGAYQGAKARAVAFDHDLTRLWEVETHRGARYLATDGSLLWTAAEGSQRLIAVDPERQDLALVGPPLGMTVDQPLRHGDRVLFPSHLTDELWWVDLTTNSAEGVSVCGWPTTSLLHEGELWLPCQHDGVLWRLDPRSLEQRDLLAFADSFNAPCSTSLCDDAHVGMDFIVAFGEPVFSDPGLPGLRWARGGTEVVLEVEPEHTDTSQHLGLRQLGWDIVVHEPWTRMSWLVRDGVLRTSHDWGSTNATYPLRGGGERIWLGGTSIDSDHQLQELLDFHVIIAAISDEWLIAEHGWDIELYDRSSLEPLAELSMAELRAPPFVQGTTGAPGPLSYLIVDELLVVANTFRGTLELRRLPSLDPIGPDEPLPLGAWAHLDGLR